MSLLQALQELVRRKKELHSAASNKGRDKALSGVFFEVMAGESVTRFNFVAEMNIILNKPTAIAAP
jgi:hypothetical protein